jgi:hypothetical protein
MVAGFWAFLCGFGGMWTMRSMILVATSGPVKSLLGDFSIIRTFLARIELPHEYTSYEETYQVVCVSRTTSGFWSLLGNHAPRSSGRVRFYGFVLATN